MYKLKYSKLINYCATFAAMLLVVTPSIVLAATTPQTKTATPPPQNPTYGQALEIAPPVIYLNVSPGHQVVTME
jgi:hypothetical protein